LQTIAEFSLVDLPIVPAGPIPKATAAPEMRRSPDASVTRVAADGRMYLIILDDSRLRVQYSAQVRRMATIFVRDHMSRGDVAAVIFTSGAKGLELTDDRSLLHMAVDKLWSENLVDRNSDVQRNQRVDTVWKMIFGPLARDESVIRHETAGDVEAIWKSFRTIYEDKQDWVTPTMALYRAIIESGKSVKLGVTSVADTKANTVTWSFPGGGKITLGGRPEDGDYYRYDIPGQQKIRKIKPIPVRI